MASRQNVRPAFGRKSDKRVLPAASTRPAFAMMRCTARYCAGNRKDCSPATACPIDVLYARLTRQGLKEPAL